MHGTSILFIAGAGVALPSRCIVQYWFMSGREHEVIIKPHGNSKRNKSYYRTLPSTLKKLKLKIVHLKL